MIDPANSFDAVADVLLRDGKVAAVGPDAAKHSGSDCEQLDACGKIVCPGLIDIHVHLREPGQTAKESIASGTQAAARGGFTTVVCMPNTSPSIDNPAAVGLVREKAAREGVVNVFATNQTSMDLALKRINGIVAIPEVNAVYDGVVKSIMPFGAFVEFMPGKDGLLHISEIKWERLETMDGVLEVGEQIKVKLTEIDKKTGKFRLSRKVLIPKATAPSAE